MKKLLITAGAIIGWLVLLVVVLIGILVAISLWPETEEQRAERMQNEIENLETEVVKIELSGQHFDIPMRYLYGQAIEKYRQWPKAKKDRVTVDALSLSVLLPDLRPYYPEDDERWKVKGHGDRVEVNITNSLGSDRWYSAVRQRIDNEVKQGLTTRLANIYGLIRFSTPLGPKYFPVPSSHELTINCDQSNSVPFPSCSTKSNYRPGIVLEYYYGLDHLPRWREIDNGLKAMFDRFSQTALSEQSIKDE